jgi:peroxiredoxin
MKKYLFTLLCLFFSIAITAQGYEIPLKINNLTDSTIYLGHQFGNGYFVNDSVKLDKNGQATFKGQTKLKGGIYFLILPKNKYFDFLIDNNQQFSITCDTSDFFNTVKFKNSYQNDKFYAYQRYLIKKLQEINAKKESQKRYITKLDTLMLIQDDIDLSYNKIYLQKEEIIAEHPDSLISVLIKASLPIVPPPAPRDSSGAMLDSSFAYRYSKQHFFDNINFADERLLQTAILQNKVFEYLTQMSIPQYDSIIIDVDYIIAKSAANAEVYKFVLNSLFQYYIKSNVITDENVFVYIAENYFLKGKTPWATPEFTEKLKADIASRKPCLIGQLAPDFQMKDDKTKIINLRTIQNKFLILYFYDVDCEICQQVTPEMMNFYRIIKDRGVDIVGIYTGKDKVKWAKYIEEKHLNWKNVWDPDNKSGFREKYNISGTPMIYLLDENQKIVAKKITVEQLMGYFNSIQ